MSFWKPEYSKIGGLGDPNGRYSKGEDHMIKRVFENNDSMYYCTLCNRPFKALHEANEHGRYCGQAVPIQPAFKSVTTAATFDEDDDTQTYQRPWVGLTDDDYQQILKQHNGAGLLAFYNLVEAKLKEKNT